MQNPGRFILDASEFRTRLLSMPRNPSIIRFFRYPKLSENAGYGIDKILKWKNLTGKDVLIESNLMISTIIYPLKNSNLFPQSEGINDGINDGNGGINGGINGGNSATNDVNDVNDVNNDVNDVNLEKNLIEILKAGKGLTISEIAASLNVSKSKVDRLIATLKKRGVLKRIGSSKTGYWKVKI